MTPQAGRIDEITRRKNAGLLLFFNPQECSLTEVMGCASGHGRKGLIYFIGSLSDVQEKGTYVNISEQRNKPPLPSTGMRWKTMGMQSFY